MSTRKDIFLVGHMKHQITGSKLPSNGDCLKVLFYNMRVTKLNLAASARLVIDECIIFWEKARIPTRDRHKCKEKLIKLHVDWRQLLKNKNKDSEHFREKENNFVEMLENLFDIAHQNALQMIRINEDKQFLLKQREKGRPGSMLGIDMKETNKEKRKSDRQKREDERRQRISELPCTSSGKFALFVL